LEEKRRKDYVNKILWQKKIAGEIKYVGIVLFCVLMEATI
jgi:hypothetical protein